jgi:hypothetical protein
LLLLKKGGKVVYHGPIGTNCSTLVQYFERRGATKIDLGENPANWMLKVMTDATMGDMAENYAKSREFVILTEELEMILQNPKPEERITFQSEFATKSAYRQGLVSGRIQLIYWRSPSYNLVRMTVAMLVGFVLGAVFITKRNQLTFTEVSLRARISVVFLSFIIMGIIAMLPVIPVMTRIRDMFYRHRDASMYDAASVAWALGVAEKYFIVLSSTLFCLVFLAVTDMSNSLGGLIGFWVRWHVDSVRRSITGTQVLNAYNSFFILSVFFPWI